MVTVFMKVMVKRRIRGSTRSQSERSIFKIVFTGEEKKPQRLIPSWKGLP